MVALAIVGVAFTIGAAFHLRDVLAGGLFPYDFAPRPLNVFWTALLPLDLAVVALLGLSKVRVALALGLAIMSADVAVNAYALFALDWREFASALAMQAGFFGYLLGVAPFLWKREDAK